MSAKSLGILAATILVVPALAHAGADRAGTTAANFLSAGAGARSLGMGGAGVALTGDLDRVPWNVASLAWLGETEFAASHAGDTDHGNQEWLAAGGRLIQSRARWSASALHQGEGSIQGRDAANQSTGDFNAGDMALSVQGGRPLGRIASMGLGAKWVTEGLGPAMRGSGLTFDAGVMVRYGMLALGAAAQNALGHMTFGSSKYPFPTNYGLGIAVDHAATGLRLALDANFPTAYYTDLRGGAEWHWEDHLALRTGYRSELGAASSEALSGPSFGLGAGTHGVWLDYAYVISAASGDGQHHVALVVQPDRMSWGSGDPFGQKTMRQDYNERGLIGPVLPDTTATPARGKSGRGKAKKGA